MRRTRGATSYRKGILFLTGAQIKIKGNLPTQTETNQCRHKEFQVNQFLTNTDIKQDFALVFIWVVNQLRGAHPHKIRGGGGTRLWDLSKFRYTDIDTIDRKTTLHYLHIQTRSMLGPTFYFPWVFRGTDFLYETVIWGGGRGEYPQLVHSHRTQKLVNTKGDGCMWTCTY